MAKRIVSVFLTCLLPFSFILNETQGSRFLCPPTKMGDRSFAKNFTDGVYFQDLTNGENFPNGSIRFENTTYNVGTYFERDGTTWGCICSVKQCVRKCCHDKEVVYNKTCTNTEYDGTDIYNFSIVRNSPFNELHTIYGRNRCKNNSWRLFEDSNFYVQENGNLFLKKNETYDLDNYCITVLVILKEDGEKDLAANVCAPVKDERDINFIGMIISLPFLFITFLVYLLDPKLNFYGRCIMCYVSTLFCAYLFLTIIHLCTIIEKSLCTALGILCYLFFLVSFFWLNTMCLHMWRMWGKQRFSQSKNAERKLFYKYSCYAWGSPLVMVAIVTLLQFVFRGKNKYLPSIGMGQCWFTGDLQSLIYFYGPVTVLIAVNIVLFSITEIKLCKTKKDTAILKKDDKEWSSLTSKLILAMGVNWGMDVLSFYFRFVDNRAPRWIWYFTDFCNASYGVFIFFLYAFSKVRTACRGRYNKMLGRSYDEKTVAHTTSQSMTATVSFQ